MSATTVYDDIAQAEPKRDGYGRYMIVPAKGGKAVAHTRATTVAETLDDRYNLELWKMRQVALGLAARHDLLAQVAAHTADDKKTLNAVCKQAMDAAAAQSGANMGTALHRIIERLNRGELDDVPEMFVERVEAFTDVMTPFAIRTDLIERVAVLGTHRIAGMFDMGVELGGTLYVADLKTGSGIDFGARGFAVQLAIYANAETLYDYGTDTHVPAPGFDQDKALVIHLPAAGGPCELHWLDIKAGAEALEHAMWTRKWRSNKKLLTPFTSFAATNTERPARIEPIHVAGEYQGPDEGPTIEDAQKKAETAIKDRLSDDLIRRLGQWVSDGDAAKRPWRLSALESERRFTLYRGAVRLLELCEDDDETFSETIARQIVELVIGEELQPSMRIGMALGAMTLPEARRLVEVADTFITKGLTWFDGKPALAVVA